MDDPVDHFIDVAPLEDDPGHWWAMCSCGTWELGFCAQSASDAANAWGNHILGTMGGE